MSEFNLACPTPISDYRNVLLAHGGGGTLTHQLIERMFVPLFGSPELSARHDGAALQIGNTRLAFTTDSYVVRPLFFPGGNIGSLAVHGTVNDLAMCGARPLYLSAGFVLEEGLPMETLWRVAQSLQQAASVSGVHVVTGDTKVVDKGKADGIFINTAGIGVIEGDWCIAPQSVRLGDVVLISGDVGRHGMAIMAVREGLEFETTIESDSAPVADIVQRMLSAGVVIHCLRDLTRGGLASALNEIAQTAGVTIHIDEARVPVREDVRAACEILGFDPLYVACEGRFVAFVAPHDQATALEIMRSHALDEGAQAIGVVEPPQSGSRSHPVIMRSVVGTTRVMDMLSGEQLPRIC